MAIALTMGEMHRQIQDFPKLCESEELVFIFNHLLANLPAQRVEFWLKEPDSDKLQLAWNRNTKGLVSYDPPIQLPITEGIAGSVFREQKAEADVGLYRSKEASPNIDQKIHQSTGYHVSVTFSWGEKCLGALSMVQLLNEPLANPRACGFPSEVNSADGELFKNHRADSGVTLSGLTVSKQKRGLQNRDEIAIHSAKALCQGTQPLLAFSS